MDTISSVISEAFNTLTISQQQDLLSELLERHKIAKLQKEIAALKSEKLESKSRFARLNEKAEKLEAAVVTEKLKVAQLTMENIKLDNEMKGLDEKKVDSKIKADLLKIKENIEEIVASIGDYSFNKWNHDAEYFYEQLMILLKPYSHYRFAIYDYRRGDYKKGDNPIIGFKEHNRFYSRCWESKEFYGHKLPENIMLFLPK